MKLFRTGRGVVVEDAGHNYLLGGVDWDELLNRRSLKALLEEELRCGEPPYEASGGEIPELLSPVNKQEVWAAGVTYLRSRTARMEESEAAGGGSFYDRVYEADRPEIFFKTAGWRVVGHEGQIRIRRDSRWNVPEPELALFVNSAGEIIGYTIGNDVSSRDIEGENPLYLPQAKSYDGACALGPGILLADGPLPLSTEIQIEILRAGSVVFEGATDLAQMKRTPAELVSYLYRETSFPDGCVLLTGTGVVPTDAFTLESGDEVRIQIPPIGTLTNQVR